MSLSGSVLVTNSGLTKCGLVFDTVKYLKLSVEFSFMAISVELRVSKLRSYFLRNTGSKFKIKAV